jgi:hypothetical protein
MLVIVGAGLSVLIAAGYSSAQDTTTVIDSTTTTSTVTVVPDITSISPASHEAAEFELTIDGTNFDNGALDQIYSQEGVLIVQGTENSVISRSSMQLVVRENMVDFTPGTYIIKVKNSDEVFSNGKELVITVPPVTSSTTSSTPETTSVSSSSTTTSAAVTTTTTARSTTTSTIRPTTSSSSSTTTSAAVTTTTARSTTTSTIRPTTSSSSSSTTTVALTTTSTAAATISITLGWSPNSESDIGGYVIYYGLSSRNYTFTKDVGNKTSGTVTGLEVGRTYYFALKAYNTSGLYSNYSTEITYPLVAVTTTTIGANTTTTIGANTSTTTAVSRGGGGGGGGGGSYSPTTSTTTTTVITVKTTSTTTTIPQCLNDGACDDGSFCSGKETCVNGICVAGQSPCAEGQVCNDDADECRDTVKLTAYFLPPTIGRPLLLAKRCTWLLLISAGKNNFNENSIIDFSGPSGEAAGLKLNPDRKPFAIGSFIFLPVCIQKDAVAGKVILTIRSEAHENNTTIEEVIETSFMVQ